MMSRDRRHLARLIAAVAIALAPCTALTQGAKGPPNALQGFSQNRDQPVKIDAATLEVRDRNKTATFSGSVQVIQGDTTLRCKTLVVFYDGDLNSTGMTAAKPGPAGQQRIRRLEARGSVVVLQKEQTATGDLGVFDMASNTVTLSGGVVMTQGTSVLKGDRLVVNLDTGVSRVESGQTTQGRVTGVFMPSQAPRQEGGTSRTAPPQSVFMPQQETPREAPAAEPKAKTPSGLY